MLGMGSMRQRGKAGTDRHRCAIKHRKHSKSINKRTPAGAGVGVGRSRGVSVCVCVCGKWTHVNFTPQPTVDATRCADGCLIACPPAVSLCRTHPLGFKLRTRSPAASVAFLCACLFAFLRPIIVAGYGIGIGVGVDKFARPMCTRPLCIAPPRAMARRHLREQARPGQAAYYLIRGALQNITKSFAI